jgi:acetoin utilization deacetylase AcuC-like enzyme
MPSWPVSWKTHSAPCVHQATTPVATRPWAFAFFNNVAIAARYALERHGLPRVAMVDFDVHHGNGTEDILRATRAC